MKKVLAFLLVVLSVFSLLNCTAIAADVEPRWNNTSSAAVSLVINENGKATISLICNGIAGVATNITAETKLERKWGLFWLDVDGAEWTDTTTNNTMALSHYVQLSKKATYRATTKYIISGTNGSDDETTCRCEYVYD